MKKVVIIPILLLQACSTNLTNADKQYLQSKNGTKLVVPAPLTDKNTSHFYDLPDQNKNPRVSIAPPIPNPLKQTNGNG